MALTPLSGSSTSGPEENDAPIVAEINITPLVDVFLVLLIIFMVTTSVMSQLGVDVKLPQASSGVSESQPEGAIVTLMKSGQVKINGEAVPMGDWDVFQSRLKTELDKAKTRLVILEGDREILLGSAIELMDRSKKAGAERFAIATEPK